MRVRPSRASALLATAAVWAGQSTCPRLQVGAVLARDGHPVAIGYNGAPRGLEHCPDPHPDGPCERSVHAERNAINDAARRGAVVEGAHLYCTHAPCRGCAGDLVNAGVTVVHYRALYRCDAGLELLRAAGVHCAHVT